MRAEEEQNKATDIEAHQNPSRGFTGTISLQLPDLIQMVCLCRTDLSIYVTSSSGSGSIHIKGGRIYHAQTEKLLGDQAFYEILHWNDGHFETGPSRETEESSVTKPWEHLLLEVARRRDEGTTAPGSSEVEIDFDSGFLDAMGPSETFNSVEPANELLVLNEGSSPEGLLNETQNYQPDMGTTKVLIVDDSPFFARRIKEILEADCSIKVAGIAGNGKEALDLLASDPSVNLITLDIQMPIMKGDTALKHIMVRHPIPVLMVSSFDPDSLGKIFEFMQLGAVDFIPKPGALEDVVAYGQRLCDLVKRAAKADTKRFRRFRRLKERASSPLNAGSNTGSPKGVLVILGAEGAFMDWFRLPLADLCNSGLVIGLQKLEDQLVSVFCRFIRENFPVRIEPAPSSGSIAPGSLFLGNANCRVALSVDRQSMALTITEGSPSGKMEWYKGIESWLGGLAEQFQDQLSVYLLSGAHALEPAVIDKLMEYESRLILSPRENVMCTDLVESVRDYGYLYPEKILCSSSEELPKALGWESIQ